MATDAQIYCDCMVRIRHRINVVQTIMSGGIKILGQADQTAELIFVQFRKTLEEIAFATLSANKEKYAEVHANFSKHWRAKDMLAVMDTVNPNFYPVPLQAPIQTAPGYKHFESLTDGFVTRDDFVLLYNCSSEALHTRNPYKEGDPTINIKYTVQEWVARFQLLLSWHYATLLNGDVWVVNIPGEGGVHVYPATPMLER